MAKSKSVIALDVGGSSVKSGAVELASYDVHEFVTTSIDSRGSAENILSTLSGIIHHHWRHDAIAGVGLGFPGPFDYTNGISRIKAVEKYEAIYDMNIHDALKSQLPDAAIPIRFRNDAEAAIVGEGVYGVGKAYSRIIGLTLGTGCGSTFLVDGVPQKSGKGVPHDGWVYPLRYQGERVDDLFSTRGLLKRFADASIGVNSVAKAVRLAETHSAIRSILESFGADLALFLQPWAQDFEADVIVLQGGIARGFIYFSDAMREHLDVPVRAGQLGRDAALLGIANLFAT